MPESPDEEKPLAAAAPASSITSSYRVCIKCCGCLAAGLLIAITITLILTFTIFRIRDPILQTSSFHIREGGGLDHGFTSNNNTLRLKLEVCHSLRNPNLGAFRIRRMSLLVYYHGLLVGEAAASRLEGEVPARETLWMNNTVGVAMERDDGILVFDTNTTITGVVRITSLHLRHITLSTTCSVHVNLSSSGSLIHQQNCRT